MITLLQAQQYLASVGIKLPEFMLQLLIDRAVTIQPCLDEHYDAATSTLILLYLIGLFGVVQGDKYVSSHSAPSGASESFRYGTLTERYKSGRNLLELFDPYGCTGALIPALPGSNGGMWIGRGGCDCV